MYINCNFDIDLVKLLSHCVKASCQYIVQQKDAEKKLGNKMDELHVKKLLVEELIPLTRSTKATNWVSNVNRTMCQKQMLDNDYKSGNRSHLCECCQYTCSTYNFVTRANEIVELADRLQKEGEDFPIMDWKKIQEAVEWGSVSHDIVGRASQMAEVQEFLKKDGGGILGIRGMAGAGKSTFLQKINNDFVVEFDVVIWFDSSMSYYALEHFHTLATVDAMQKHISHRLHLPWEENATLASDRARVICNILKSRKVLILIDNLKADLNLEEVGIPYPSENSTVKVLFTTQFDLSLPLWNSHQQIDLKRLEDEDALCLFRKHGADRLLEAVDPSIKDYIWRVYKNCNGNPQTLITTAKALKNMKSREELLTTSKMMEKILAGFDIEGMDKNLHFALRVNYSELRTSKRKECFLTCSLWPNGHSISVNELLECWMGLGLIDIEENSKEGSDIVETLKHSSLLEPGNVEHTEVKMHYSLRIFALHKAREDSKKPNKWLVEENANNPSKWSEAECISLINSTLEVRLPRSRPCSELSTLILRGCKQVEIIPAGCFRCMNQLKYLDLSGTKIRNLPDDIGELVKLQYINLSRTIITSLPLAMSMLVKLRFLNLEGTTALCIIPKDVIQSLHSLQFLNLYESGFANWVAVEYERREIEIINDHSLNIVILDELEVLHFIGVTINTEAGVVGLSKIISRTWGVYITELEGSSSLHLRFLKDDNMNVRKITIADCADLKQINIYEASPVIEDIHDNQNGFEAMYALKLLRLGGLEEVTLERALPDNIRAPYLTTLTIHGCDKLKDVSWILELGRLEKLELSSCNRLQRVIDEVSAIARRRQYSPLPALKLLVLEELPSLESLCSHAWFFHSLQELHVTNCEKLRSLPAELITEKIQIIASNQWWDALAGDSMSKYEKSRYTQAQGCEYPPNRPGPFAAGGSTSAKSMPTPSTSSGKADLTQPTAGTEVTANHSSPHRSEKGKEPMAFKYQAKRPAPLVFRKEKSN